METISIKRGDILYADLSPVLGSEQGGTRPVLVIQNDTGNLYSSTIIVASITSRSKAKLPTHVFLDVPGLHVSSIALLEQIRTIDKSRIQKPIGKLSQENMRMVDRAILISLGIGAHHSNSMVMSLCDGCLQSFHDSGDYITTRLDRYQDTKEPCMICNVKTGFDFEISRR